MFYYIDTHKQLDAAFSFDFQLLKHSLNCALILLLLLYALVFLLRVLYGNQILKWLTKWCVDCWQMGVPKTTPTSFENPVDRDVLSTLLLLSDDSRFFDECCWGVDAKTSIHEAIQIFLITGTVKSYSLCFTDTNQIFFFSSNFLFLLRANRKNNYTNLETKRILSISHPFSVLAFLNR